MYLALIYKEKLLISNSLTESLPPKSLKHSKTSTLRARCRCQCTLPRKVFNHHCTLPITQVMYQSSSVLCQSPSVVFCQSASLLYSDNQPMNTLSITISQYILTIRQFILSVSKCILSISQCTLSISQHLTLCPITRDFPSSSY